MTARTVPTQFYLPSKDFTPAYLALGAAELRRRADEALELLRDCIVCPRDCHVNRLEDKFAVCKTGRHAIVGSFFAHFGEEDCLRGWRGSGTIFFSMCNLRCAFCFSAETPVLTEFGMRRIEDIFAAAQDERKVGGGQIRSIYGLRAWTHSGKLAPIVKAYRHLYKGSLVRIHADGLSPILGTPNHKVFAAEADSHVEKVAAGELTIAHFLVKPRLPMVSAVMARGRPEAQERMIDRSFVRIRAIDRIEHDGPVYNLEIDDPDHSYLAGGVGVANCQNYDISQQGEGRVVTPEQLASMMLHLQDQGCHNINFVTPEHVVPQVLEALPIAVEHGLRLPIVYNTSSYDSMHSMRLMDGIVDIYMPDFKYWDREMARHYMKAPNYPEVARRIIMEMHRQVGPLKLDEFGLAKRGLIIRHLVMPGATAGTHDIMRWIASELGTDTYVNVMAQYYPAGQVGRNPKYEAINRKLLPDEFEDAVQAARDAGLSRLDVRIPRSPWLRWDPLTSPMHIIDQAG